MDSRSQRIATIRLYVLIGSCAGLAMILALAIVREGDAFSIENLAFTSLLSLPYVLVLLSLACASERHQRRLWLVAALMTFLSGLALIFNGVGFFILGIALCYGWAFAATSDRRSQPSL